MNVPRAARWTLAGIFGLNLAGAFLRVRDRKRVFDEAARRAQALGRPLVVVGDPDGGLVTSVVRAYGCGDVCVDLSGCQMCPVARAHDLTAGPTPGVADGSAVVFVSCVLEYVSDFDRAWREVLRMAGTPDNVFVVRVEPWTLTSFTYPGALRTIEPQDSGHARPVYVERPISPALLGAASLAFGALGVAAIQRSGR